MSLILIGKGMLAVLIVFAVLGFLGLIGAASEGNEGAQVALSLMFFIPVLIGLCVWVFTIL
jgi:hypothetical protein